VCPSKRLLQITHGGGIVKQSHGGDKAELRLVPPRHDIEVGKESGGSVSRPIQIAMFGESRKEERREPSCVNRTASRCQLMQRLESSPLGQAWCPIRRL
jgi:hypothetical protein